MTPTDYDPGPFGPGPEFGAAEVEFDQRWDFRDSIADAKASLQEACCSLNDLKGELQQDIDVKVRSPGAHKEVKTDQLEVVEDVMEALDDAICRMEEV